jgi:hypothetical protein
LVPEIHKQIIQALAQALCSEPFEAGYETYPASFFVNMQKLVSSGRNKTTVTLSAAFSGQEIIISAAHVIRVFPANFRARFIDGAATLGLVKELAHAFVDMIFSVAQYTVAPGDFRKFFLSVFVRQFEVFRQAQQILFRHFNPVITATIAGTFRTIEKYSQRTRGLFVIGYFHQFFLIISW